MKTRIRTLATISLSVLSAHAAVLADDAKTATPAATEPTTVAATTTDSPAKPAAAAPATPPRDPTLIEVPTNTLGPGTPLWVRREQEKADARVARADAEYAEARADLARVETQRAADDRYYGTGDGIVIYGPHQPGLSRALLNRPIVPTHIARPIASTSGGINDEDPFAAAQFRFFNTANPPIGPAIESQLQAQRRFGANATPQIIEPQRQRDNAVINARRPAPMPH